MADLDIEIRKYRSGDEIQIRARTQILSASTTEHQTGYKTYEHARRVYLENVAGALFP